MKMQDSRGRHPMCCCAAEAAYGPRLRTSSTSLPAKHHTTNKVGFCAQASLQATRCMGVHSCASWPLELGCACLLGKSGLCQIYTPVARYEPLPFADGVLCLMTVYALCRWETEIATNLRQEALYR